MRLLILHVSRFAYTATQKGRSRLVEPLAEKTSVFEDGLLILAAAEAGDERSPAELAARGAAEVVELAEKLGARRALVVLGHEDELNWLSLRNEPSVHLIEAGQLNTYDVLVADEVVFTRDALDEFLGVPAESTKEGDK